MSGSDADIIIRVGAAADSSFKTFFDSIPHSAAKASTAANKALSTSATQAERQAERAAQRETKAKESVYRQTQRIEARATAGVAREADRQAKAKERALEYVARVRTRHFEQQQRDEERAARATARKVAENAKREERASADRGRRGAGYVSGAIGSVGRAAIGIGTSIAGGAGLNFDIGSHVANAVKLNAVATKIANSNAFATGTKATANDVGDITNTVKGAAGANSMDYGDVAGGLDAFVAKTGDLKLAKETLSGMSELASASGASMTDLSGAAGEVANALGNVPGKGAKMLEILRAITKQGAEGSVEIKDLAQYGARLSGMAEFIQGDRSSSISQLSWIAQMAKSHGGATDAAEATGAASSFVNNLMKGKSADRLRGSGVEVFTDDKHTKLRSTGEIMADIFEKTGGDLEQISKLVPNESARKAVRGFASTYNDAGGGKAGADAIRKSFGEHAQALSEDDVKSASDLYKNSDAAKVQDANNKIADAMTRLLPAVEKMIPNIEKAAEAFGQFINFAGDNPWTVVAGAIAGKIAMAAGGDMISKALEKALGTAGGGIFAGATVAFTIGMATIEVLASAKDRGVNNAVGDAAQHGNTAAAEKGFALTQVDYANAVTKYGAGSDEAKAALANVNAAKSNFEKERATTGAGDASLEEDKKTLAESSWGTRGGMNIGQGLSSMLGLGGVSFTRQSEIEAQGGVDAAFNRGNRPSRIDEYIRGGGEATTEAATKLAGPGASLVEIVQTAVALKEAAAALKESATHISNAAGGSGKGIDPAGRTSGAPQ